MKNGKSQFRFIFYTDDAKVAAVLRAIAAFKIEGLDVSPVEKKGPGTRVKVGPILLEILGDKIWQRAELRAEMAKRGLSNYQINGGMTSLERGKQVKVNRRDDTIRSAG